MPLTSVQDGSQQPAVEATERADAVVETRSLRKEYPNGKVAVEGLDLTIRAGEVFGLLGPNGAGKSTTIMMLTTLLRPTSGAAVVGGFDVIRDPVRAKGAIGVVSQGNTLDRNLTTEKLLYFHGRYYGLTRSQARPAADRVLQLFDLEEYRCSAAATLSGGLARRVQIARAMLHEPAILFLDEPTAGLDPHSRREVWMLIRTLSDQGVTVLLTTHHLEEAEELCDRLAIIDGGALRAIGTPSALIEKHGDGARIFLRLAHGSDAVATLIDQQDDCSWAKDPSGRITITTSDPDAVLGKVLALGKATTEVEDVTIVRPSLETVFMNLAGRRIM